MPIRTHLVRTFSHADGPSGPLAAGERAGPGLVGYLGDEGDLTELTPLDSPPTGCSWDGDALLVGNNVTLDHYFFNGVTLYATGSNVTVTDSKLIAPSGQTFGMSSAASSGFFVVKDCTVIGTSGGSPSEWQVNGVSADAGLIAVRCDISGTGDGIHAVAWPSTWTSGEVGYETGTNSDTGSIIYQCYVHDLAFTDEEQHLDAIQIFQHSSSTGYMRIEHNYTDRTLSGLGTPMNAGLTIGPASASGPLIQPFINNNLFRAGLYHARMNFQLTSETFTNNNLDQEYASEFGLVSVEVTIDTWSNNRDGVGAAGTGNLVNHP